MINTKRKRCKWVNLDNERYVLYHDNEWGRRTYDDRELYELLILESFQAGLSWECILNKRNDFRKAFDNFNVNQVVKYDEKKIEELMKNEKIVRHRKKIEAAISNSKVFKEIQKEYGSFSEYIWHFTKHKVIIEENKTTSPLSDEVSKDLKKRGMKFVGSTIVYSYLQAIGVINSHEKDSFCYFYK